MEYRVLKISLKKIGLISLIVFGLTSCSDEPTVSFREFAALSEGKLNSLFVASSDHQYQTGNLALVSLSKGKIRDSVVPIHSDAIVRVGQKNIYVVNRLGRDSIQVIQKSDLAQIAEFSVGRGTNPQDIEVVGDVAYVTRLASKGLLKVSGTSGTLQEEIVLPEGAADSDGYPEMTRMVSAHRKILVQLQRLDRNNLFKPTDKAKILVFDPLTQAMKLNDLHLQNPMSDFKLDNSGNLYIACAGTFLNTKYSDAGIEKISKDSLESEAVVIRGPELGGHPMDVEILSLDLGIAIVMAFDGASKLVSFNPTTGKLLKELLAPGSFSLQGLVWDRERNLIYVADRATKRPQIRLFDASTLMEKEVFFDVGLAPFQMILSE